MRSKKRCAVVKYIYNVSPLYIHFKKHYCPKCRDKLEVRYKSEIINYNSDKAGNYNFTLGDGIYRGDIEFRVGDFFCPNCDNTISFKDMKQFEKESKNK
jgi:predicted RNA-binding Zn-ribbon protein involved in translation (DUF1610 family)